MFNPEDNVLYVTSCNEKLWNATGKALVNSFIKYQVPGKLCVVYEEPCYGLDSFNIDKLCLDNNDIYTQWFHKYINFIPEAFGGHFKECFCANKAHVFGCPGNFWNYNSSRWFKKVVALHEISSRYVERFIVWVDCDCLFINPIPTAYIKKLLNDCDSFCLHGVNRVAVETGIIGFNGFNGRTIISDWLYRYTSGKFLETERWDDGYQYTILKRTSGYKFKDIATDPLKMNPAEFCKLTPYIKHAKGIHKRLYKLFSNVDEETI